MLEDVFLSVEILVVLKSLLGGVDCILKCLDLWDILLDFIILLLYLQLEGQNSGTFVRVDQLRLVVVWRKVIVFMFVPL